MTNTNSDNKLLEEYLQGRSPLSDIYHATAQAQPPVALDRELRKQAKQAVGTRVAASPFSSNWMIPTSLAAILVLTVGVVVLLPNDGTGLFPTEVPVDDLMPMDAASTNGFVSPQNLGRHKGSEATRAYEAPGDTTLDIRKGLTDSMAPEAGPEAESFRSKEFLQQESQDTPVLVQPNSVVTSPMLGSEPGPLPLFKAIKYVRPGMTQAQVKALLGPATRSSADVWYYTDEPEDHSDNQLAGFSYEIHFLAYRVNKVVITEQ